MIKVSHLSRSYGQFKAVNDVSFEVGKGQIVGLLGPNGAGKTTLMKILTGFHYPSSGDAWIGGVDVQADPQAAQALIGYLPESSPIYPDLTVLEYMDFMAGIRRIPQNVRGETIQHVLERTAADGFRNKVVGHLSKGQKQRVGLAQAILSNPEILILDEPTTGLDPNQILEFRHLIQEIGHEKTVILSTHIMQEVEAICGRVLIMNQGRIVAEGEASDIAKRLQGEDRFRLRLKGTSGSVALEGLKRLSNKNSEPILIEDSADPLLECSFASNFGGAEALFDWAVSQHYKILALIPQNLSLEDLFVQLTKETPHETNV
ncbi:MAG: ABC transporter ATP-binding protein [Spirochaetales bacterium]|nr:ABC transporter ATP-binding protein [Spirochaetales bacterium]